MIREDRQEAKKRNIEMTSLEQEIENDQGVLVGEGEHSP